MVVKLLPMQILSCSDRFVIQHQILVLSILSEESATVLEEVGIHPDLSFFLLKFKNSSKDEYMIKRSELMIKKKGTWKICDYL